MSATDTMLAIIRDHENRMHPEIKKREIPAGCACYFCLVNRDMARAARHSLEAEFATMRGIATQHYRWRSIEDSVPPEDELVLLRENSYSNANVFVGMRECNVYKTAILGPNGKRWEVTPAHWMPIPPLDALEMKP